MPRPTAFGGFVSIQPTPHGCPEISVGGGASPRAAFPILYAAQDISAKSARISAVSGSTKPSSPSNNSHQFSVLIGPTPFVSIHENSYGSKKSKGTVAPSPLNASRILLLDAYETAFPRRIRDHADNDASAVKPGRFILRDLLVILTSMKKKETVYGPRNVMGARPIAPTCALQFGLKNDWHKFKEARQLSKQPSR